MMEVKGIMVLKLNGASYSRAAADDLVNTLLLNGYTVSLKQVNAVLLVEYTGKISEVTASMFPLLDTQQLFGDDNE